MTGVHLHLSAPRPLSLRVELSNGVSRYVPIHREGLSRNRSVLAQQLAMIACRYIPDGWVSYAEIELEFIHGELLAPSYETRGAA